MVSIGVLHAAHITDKLVVGIYAEPSVEGSPMTLISSGTPLEVLERKTKFVRVRMADQTTGWVESAYVTEEKPAKAVLLETQTKLRQVKKELDALKAAQSDGEGDGTVSASSTLSDAVVADLQAALTEAQARVRELETQAPADAAQAPGDDPATSRLAQLESRVQQAIDVLSAADGVLTQPVAAASQAGVVTRFRPWIIGLIALFVGFGIGVVFIDYRFRKRYAGLRI